MPFVCDSVHDKVAKYMNSKQRQKYFSLKKVIITYSNTNVKRQKVWKSTLISAYADVSKAQLESIHGIRS